MTDFTLIRIYPALITLREVGSECPAFNATGWRAPTPACCYQPGWVLVLCAPPRHKDRQQGLAGWHLTQHAAPLPQLGGPRGVAHVGTQGWVPSKWHLRRCVVGHGWWSSRLSCGHVRPCCATLCHVAVPGHVVPCPPAPAAAEQPLSHPGNTPCTHSTLNVLFGESAVVSRD